MAIDQERMVVVLEARLDKLEKGFQKARQAANTNLNAIVTDANKMEAALSRVGSGGFNRVTQSAGALRAQTANVSAQFQDIAVQLAGGQSPFLIALQQGTQLTAALGPGGLGSALKALGSGFASLLNPLGLLTIGVISLGGIAVQKLLEWYNAGQLTEKQLREQESLIRAVADRWGDALPAIRAYVAELDKIKDVADRKTAVDAIIGAEFDKATQKLTSFLTLMAGADFSAFDAAANQAIDNTARLEDAAGDLETKIKEGKATTEDFARVQQLLSELISSTAIPATGQLRDTVVELAAAYNSAAREAGRTAAANAGIGGGRTSRLSTLPALSQYDFERRVAGAGEVPGKVGEQWGEVSKKGKRDAAAEAAKREAQAVADLIAQLEFERSLIGLTEVEKEKANALRRAGSAATDEQRAKIEALTEQIYLQEQAQKAAKTAADEQKRAMEELGQIGTDAINGIVGALEDGKISGEELIQIVGRLIQQLMSMPNGGFGSFLSSFFGGGGSFGSSWTGATGPWGKLPGFASGTSSAPGGLSWVGERGPELMNVPRGAQIIPSAQSLAMARGRGGTSATVQVTIDARGADREGLSRVEAQVARLKSEVPALAVQAMRKANKSNVKF